MRWRLRLASMALLLASGCGESEEVPFSEPVMTEKDHAHYHVHAADVSHEHEHTDDKFAGHEHTHKHPPDESTDQTPDTSTE